MAKALVVQTAFIGDVVLSMPLASALRREGFETTFVVAPRAAEVPAFHPDVSEVVIYDKRGRDRGPWGLLRIAESLRRRKFEVALVPHRSIRSATLALLGGVPERIGFSSHFGFLYTASVSCGDGHKVIRNLSLLRPIGVFPPPPEPPWLFPGRKHEEVAISFLREHGLWGRPLVAMAPGSVWPTKRWVPEGFKRVAEALVKMGVGVVLIGGAEDRELCRWIARGLSPEPAVAAGRTSVMESAALLRLCSVLVSNDSAPVHMASAVGMSVVAIFGPTVPAFGFGPYGPGHSVVELDLPCRPCSAHGGRRCPEGHFMCMRGITPQMVLKEVEARLSGGRTSTGPGIKEDGRIFLENVNAGRYKADVTVWYFDEEGHKVETEVLPGEKKEVSEGIIKGGTKVTLYLKGRAYVYPHQLEPQKVEVVVDGNVTIRVHSYNWNNIGRPFEYDII